MGCVTSSDKSPKSSFYHPEGCFSKSYSWINRSKKNYKVEQQLQPPPLPTKGRPISRSKSSLPVATRTTEVLSICDDFQEGYCYDDEKSYGYFSESISTANTSSPSFNPNDCDLKMEMYMMTKISRVMPKTSSPIMSTKYSSRHSPSSPTSSASSSNSNFGIDEGQQIVNQQRSYNKWKRNLQNTPSYFLNDVTRIPEAIAGQFSPEDFPAYTDVKQCQRRSNNIQQRRLAMETYII